jgi:glutathione S-transferase
MKIYGDSNSGNCLKVKWVSDRLRLPYTWIEIETMKGGSRTPEFLKLNPFGQVPTIQLDDGRPLAQSNAIMHYLARGSDLIPADDYAAAQMDAWLFWEQYSHEPYVAVARFICVALPAQHERRAELPRLHERGYQALAVMEQHLARERFFVGDAYSIADIALFAYTHVAADGGFELQNFPAVRSWIARVERQPRFLPMPAGH